MLPSVLKEKVPAKTAYNADIPTTQHKRKVIMLEGCVQPAMAPNINAASRRVLDQLGISIEERGKTGCCGALRHHLNAHEAALDDMKRNIDTWTPLLTNGAEAVIANASGCGVQIKDYSSVLAHDGQYAEAAANISDNYLDLSLIHI